LFVFDAIGTHWEIESYEPLTDGVRKKVLDRIESFDKTYSRFRTDSLVTEIASASNGGNFSPFRMIVFQFLSYMTSFIT